MASQQLLTIKNDNFSDLTLTEIIFEIFFYLRHTVVLYIIRRDINYCQYKNYVLYI